LKRLGGITNIGRRCFEKGVLKLNEKEKDIVLEALKCLRYDTERVEKLILKTKSASTDDHTDVLNKLEAIDVLIRKWRE